MKNLTIACFTLLLAGALTSCKKNIIVIPETPLDSLSIGLLAYYPFNNSGTDLSGKGNNVAYYKNITSVANRFNLTNTAFSFDGQNSYLTVNDNSDLRLSNTDFTLNAWVKLNSFSPNSGTYILSKRTSGLNSGWGFSVNGQQTNVGVIGGVYFGPGGLNASAVSTKSLSLNKWSMVTVVYNSTKQQISIYIDGVLDNVTNNIPTPNALIAANMFIGADNPANGTFYYTYGSLDDIRIYNRALSTSLVQKLYISPN